ncbi:hypothetical protein COCON_G00128510 [Conger conger]|uniref:GATA zinc finger domain-containing protein 1 n=1 Tax=Conger conger TaxID=82655 RepID=A0A9Q1DDG5_CONCO|nr:hypothetical protein COCON_G00128510 [Conger conger]
MPLGLKPCCAVCKTNSSSMWKKGNHGEILCNNCTGKHSTIGTAGPSATSSIQQNNGGVKQSKQEIHRRSARLRSTKYKAPASEKKVSTKGKGRRHIFKLKNPIKAPESVSTIITSESVFYKGVYFQIGDVIKVTDEDDGRPYYAQIRGFVQDQYCEKSAALTWLIPTQASPKDQFDASTYIIGDVIKVTDEDDGRPYYAQIRGFVQDQYCEKSAALTWLIPTQASPKDQFDASTYIIGPEEDLPRKMEYLDPKAPGHHGSVEPGCAPVPRQPAQNQHKAALLCPSGITWMRDILVPKPTTEEFSEDGTFSAIADREAAGSVARRLNTKLSVACRKVKSRQRSVAGC